MKRPVRLTLYLPLTALAVWGALFAACGGGDDDDGGDGESARAWVEDVCKLAKDTSRDIDEQQTRLLNIDFEGGEPATVRDELLSVLKDVRDERDDIIHAFQDLGSPGIKNGGDVKDAFNDNFDENQNLLDDLIKAVERLDPDSADFHEDLLAELEGYNNGKDLREYLEDVAKDNDEVNGIIAAIDAHPECADILFEDGEEEEADANNDPSAASPTRRARPTPRASGDNRRWVEGF